MLISQFSVIYGRTYYFEINYLNSLLLYILQELICTRVIKILIPYVKKEGSVERKFIDYDKYKKIFYNNLYLDEFKIVIKMPLYCKEFHQKEDLKVKKFNLEKYTYILSY